MINQETRLPYAKFDHSDTRIRQAQYRHMPSWRGAYLYCLKMRDYEAAEVTRERGRVDDKTVQSNEARLTIVLDRCLCGYDRKKGRWVRNGCKRHLKIAKVRVA